MQWMKPQEDTGTGNVAQLRVYASAARAVLAEVAAIRDTEKQNA